MAYKWVVEHTIYLLNDTDQTDYIIPTARQVYDYVFKGIVFLSVEIKNHLTDFNIEFSKYPLRLKMKIEHSYENKKIIFSVRPYLYNNLFTISIMPVKDNFADHIIVDETWYPVDQVEINTARLFLEKFNMNFYTIIKLNDVLKLIRDNEFSELFFDFEFDFDMISGEPEDGVLDNKWFKGTLYPYQEKGYRWLKLMTAENLGGILGDEMGLGKTIQVIALFAYEAKEGRKSNLVVCPSSLLENWRREIKKFSPLLKVSIHKGNDRTGYYADLLAFDVVITSYDIVVRDFSMLEMIDWNIVVADEAQFIKNSDTRRSETLRNIKKRGGIAVTGTPIENHIKDIWSIVDFSIPNYFGDFNTFTSTYTDDSDSAKRVREIITPILLRRRVAEVATDLPQRIDIPQFFEMDDPQAQEYDTIRKDIIDKYGKSATLVSIGKLRQYCTHPFLLNNNEGDPCLCSTKYQRFIEILDEIRSVNEKCIVFTSYQKMADIILFDIENRFGAYCRIIDGRTEGSIRQEIIDEFSSLSGFGVLVLNPRAAGVGLNITSANHVIHYNLEWNPALEDQASARTYRRGQKKPVTVHRLFYANTVEEIINNKLEMKRDLIENAIVGHNGDSDTKEIIAALDITPMQ